MTGAQQSHETDHSGPDPRLVSGMRSRSEDAGVEIVGPLLPAFGITRVAHVTGLDRIGIPIHVAIEPTSRVLSTGSGKGRTFWSSWLSATMEAIEQRHWGGDPVKDPLDAPPVTLARLGIPHISPNHLQLRGRSTDIEHACIPWVTAPSLGLLLERTGEEYLVPLLSVSCPSPKHAFHPLVSSTNGLASGFTLAEAVLSGLTEVVERDAFAFVDTPRDVRTRIDDELRGIAPDIFTKIEAANMSLHVVDVTSDIGVPTYTAYLYAEDDGLGVFKGAGCALDGRLALIRAVLEAVQARGIVIAGARDDIFGSQRRAGLTSRVRQPVDGYKLMDPPRPVNLSTGTIDGDIALIRRMLASRGFDVQLAFRHTPDDSPVQVVHVVVPGLEGYPVPGSIERTRLRWAVRE